MNQKSLTILCLTSFFVGVSLLLAVSQMELDSAAIKELDESMIGESVSVGGAVSLPRESNGNLFFDLQQGSHKIKTVMFKSDNDGIDLKHGQEIVVEGEVSMYKGSLELIAREIRLGS